MTWKEAYENHIQQEEKKTRDLLQKIRAAAQKHAQGAFSSHNVASVFL